MATIGTYCKAYLVQQLRQFDQWQEQDLGEDRSLNEDDILYLQENYVVTNGIFKDEEIVFAEVTPEWQDFCHTVLQFEVPSINLQSMNQKD